MPPGKYPTTVVTYLQVRRDHATISVVTESDRMKARRKAAKAKCRVCLWRKAKQDRTACVRCLKTQREAARAKRRTT